MRCARVLAPNWHQPTNPLFRGRVGPWGRCSDATETNMLQGMPWGAICVQSSDDSLNSAIRTAYRISLRSSSLREPRYPLLGVLFWLLFWFCLRFTERTKCCISNGNSTGWKIKVWMVIGQGTMCTWCLIWWMSYRGNDPSAGSPTETLLRLLLPLSSRI